MRLLFSDGKLNICLETIGFFPHFLPLFVFILQTHDPMLGDGPCIENPSSDQTLLSPSLYSSKSPTQPTGQ